MHVRELDSRTAPGLFSQGAYTCNFPGVMVHVRGISCPLRHFATAPPGRGAMFTGYGWRWRQAPSRVSASMFFL